MTVKVYLADGKVDIFETEKYMVSNIAEMHPLIVGVKVFEGGCLIHEKFRAFGWFYRKFTVKSRKVQARILAIEKSESEKSL